VLAADEEDSSAAKPVDPATGEFSSGAAKPTTTPVPGKRTLKNLKTMFYVGTEVSWFICCIIIWYLHKSL